MALRNSLNYSIRKISLTDSSDSTWQQLFLISQAIVLDSLNKSARRMASKKLS